MDDKDRAFAPATEPRSSTKPGMTMPEARHSRTLRSASPAPMGLLAVPMDFSQSSSRGWKEPHDGSGERAEGRPDAPARGETPRGLNLLTRKPFASQIFGRFKGRKLVWRYNR